MEISNIEKSERLLPILDNALSDSGLYISSIYLNSAKERFYRIATPGTVLPIAYSPENEKAAFSFLKKLCSTIECGQDFEFQARLMISDELRNSKVLLYSETPLDVPNCINSSMVNFVDLPANIATMSKEYGAKIAMLYNPPSDGINYISWGMLNNIALKHKLLIVAFLKIDEATDGLNRYLANFSHNLCQIRRGTVSTKADYAKAEITHFYSFQYGRPIPGQIIFDISENGELFVPKGIAKLLRVERCAKMLAKPVALNKFESIMFGALGGEFDASTIRSMISEACNNGILLKSGKGTKSVVSKPSQESGATRKPYFKNIGITGLWNRHRKENNYAHSRKRLLSFGETVLLMPDEENMELVCTAFIKGLITGVSSGKGFLDFKLKTDKRNTLVICVGNDYNIDEQSLNESARDARVFVRFADANITDSDFLHLLKSECNAHQPDFVCILGLDRVLISLYKTNRGLYDEVCRCAKRLGICIITSLSEPLANIADFVDVNLWQIWPLFPETLEERLIDIGGDSAPLYYCFEAAKDKHPFLSIFLFKNGIISDPDTSKCKQACLTSIFYSCMNTPFCDVWDFLSNSPVTEKRVKEAKSLEIIHEKDGYISYIGFGHE